MDEHWERSIPLAEVTADQLEHMLRDYDGRLTLRRFRAVTAGCRNSNYVAETEQGPFFVRITPSEAEYIRERAIYPVLEGRVPVPRLLHAGRLEDRFYLIYEYIDGVSLQAVCAGETRLADGLVIRAARAAAEIHSLKPSDFPGLPAWDYPPYPTWYELFLRNERAAGRMGPGLVSRVRELVAGRREDMAVIDGMRSFIHSDFRPANMMADGQGTLFIVDWEYGGEGHCLADIGQFFRYRQCFDEGHRRVFEGEYNERAPVKLPADWYQLSRLRDLVNPLQMMGADEDLPQKFRDLKAVMLDILDDLGG